MPTLNISEKLLNNLKKIEGKEIDEKILNLLRANVLMRLKECEERIFLFESKYGTDFEGFKKAWESGEMEGKHTHNVERDFIEWEGFEHERKKWLNTLREMKLRD